jgi:hypothetical protein
MTKGSAVVARSRGLGIGKRQIPPGLSRSVALMSCMRLSLPRAAHVVVAGSAKQEIRVRSGRDDKGEETAPVQQLLSLEAPLFPLSSRPERSAVERSAVSLCLDLCCGLQPHYPLSSRPERSAVERSAVSLCLDLCCGPQPHYPLSSRPERSAVERSAVQRVPRGSVWGFSTRPRPDSGLPSPDC